MAGSSPFVRFLLAITALLCSALVYASPRVHAHDRRDDTTWTAAPTKSSCANCYGIDATWTVTRVTSAVNTTPLTLTTVTSATVLAVVTEVPIPGGSVVTSTMWPLPQVSVKVWPADSLIMRHPTDLEGPWRRLVSVCASRW